jgi:hypothetical protein
MPKITITHELKCDVDTFWKLFFDKEFNDQLYKKGLGFPAFETVSQTENDKELKRTVKGQPKMDMPGPVAKLLGSSFAYTEDGVWDKTTRVWRWKMTPGSMADKLKNEGTMKIEPAGEGRCRRVAEMLIEAKMFGIGGMIESATEKAMRDGWNRSATFIDEWVAKHP